MPIGLTYVYGRLDNETTESGTFITRVAGQFTSPFTACPVRVASTHRLQLPVTSAQMTSSVGSMCIWLTPDNAYNDAGMPATGRAFSWQTDANNLIDLHYLKASALWRLTRTQAASAATVSTAAITFSANAGMMVYVGWDATTLYVSFNGATIATQAQAATGMTLPSTFDIGSIAAASVLEARYDAVACFNRGLTQAEVTAFTAFTAARPPLLGEVVGDAMSLLWYGCNNRAWTLTTGGVAIDLLAQTGVRVTALNGMGFPVMEHRNVETPLRDGSTYIDSRMRARTIKLTAQIFGTTAATWQTARRALLGKLNARLGQGLLMYAPDVANYEVDAVVNDGFGLDNFTAPRLQNPTISFSCFNPSIRVSALIVDSETITIAGLAIPLSLPMTFSEGGASSTITNGGDVDSWPTFRITASALGCTAPYMQNVTTGKIVQFSGGGNLVMTSGEILIVDMYARTATIGGVNKWNYRSDASITWPLVPGANNLKVGSTTGSATSIMRAYTQLIGV